MENCSFQSQLLSVMEVLAKAAVAEINRRVDDSCALLRLEVCQSRQDINLLKRKCEVMEAELRRNRMRARRKVFNLPAGHRFTPAVKVVLDKNSQNADWDRQMDTESPKQQQQCADLQPANEAKCAEGDTWRNVPKDKQISEASQSASFGESLFSPAHSYNTFPEQQPPRDQSETELVVKCEKEEVPDENAAPVTSGHVAEKAETQLWSSSPCRHAADPGVSQHIPTAFTPQSSQHLEDMLPRILSVSSVGKPHSVVVTAARVRRRARTFGYKRPQPDEGHAALSQINSINPSLTPQQSQHQYRDAAVHMRAASEDLRSSSSSSSFSLNLARRMRPSWRSGLGEKRFCCTYCDKSFTRFSQLKEHLRSHTGEKPFSCMQCGRSFTKQCNLIRHAVVHSGEKPYECSLCGKCFTQRSSLTSHQKTAH